jgi:superfamily II RNA helicase
MKNKDTEEMLLTNSSLEDLIKMKIETELNEEIAKSTAKPTRKVYTDIKDVPRELIFSPKATYKLFNRRNKTETFINGVQAEALIGTAHAIREKVSQGLMSAFATDDAYVKFEKACETV